MRKQNYSPFTIYYSLFFRLFALLALPLAFYSNGSAASLQGQVFEILDGENFKIISQTHQLQVRLVATAAPASSQPYADVAKQHLSDLILNKVVTVQYTGFEDGHLVGHVQCGGMDINAQMIRDGVAWYNSLEAMNLSEVERGIYQASQDAARSERRGFWQQATPVSPWDFRNAQLAAAKPKPVAVFTLPELPLPAPRSATLKASSPELSSENLVANLVRYTATAGKPDIKPLSANPAPDRWLKYQPDDRHFSILFPSNGKQMTLPVQDLQGRTLNVNYLLGPGETNFYFILWTKGPNGTATNDSTATETINAFVDGVSSASKNRAGLYLDVTPEQNVMLSGYAGKQYALTAGPISGTVRVLSKQIGEDREVFILCVLNRPDAENTGTEFFNSFKIRGSLSNH